MLEIKNLKVEIGNFILKNINLKVNEGEYFMIVGESGNGKTVLLQTIGGYYENIKGEIKLDDTILSNLNIEDRNIGIVYQNHELFPFLNVYDNIAFGLKIRKYKKIYIKDKVLEYLKIFNLENVKDRYPKNLSGGESQRVALARALITNPKVLLLDEPLNALDKLNKEAIIEELKRINTKMNLTIIHVTHDPIEAISLGNRVGVMRKGELINILGIEEFKEKTEKGYIKKILEVGE